MTDMNTSVPRMDHTGELRIRRTFALGAAAGLVGGFVASLIFIMMVPKPSRGALSEAVRISARADGYMDGYMDGYIDAARDNDAGKPLKFKAGEPKSTERAR